MTGIRIRHHYQLLEDPPPPERPPPEEEPDELLEEPPPELPDRPNPPPLRPEPPPPDLIQPERKRRNTTNPIGKETLQSWNTLWAARVPIVPTKTSLNLLDLLRISTGDRVKSKRASMKVRIAGRSKRKKHIPPPT
jgi:hypothetical protein